MARRSTRRDFLRGEAARRAIEDWLDPAPPTVALSDQGESAGNYLLTLRRRAMACEFAVMLNAGQHAAGPLPAIAALDLVEQLEEQLTIYRETSEVMEINRTAALAPVAVEGRLFELLTLAMELHRTTAGAFDITAGPLSKAWGFFRREGALPEDGDLQAALANVGSDKVLLDAERQTIAFKQPGVELNLGSIGKGYALDRCAELLGEAEVHDFLLHGGQSSVLADGSRAGGNSDNRGWPITVGDPLHLGKSLAEITLRDQAVGTSGTQYQFFRRGGKRYGHIIDPRTGWPAEGVLSCTVVAPTAALADALSTALFILGPQGAQDYCAKHPEIAALIVCPSDASDALEVWRFNWNAECRMQNAE